MLLPFHAFAYPYQLPRFGSEWQDLGFYGTFSFLAHPPTFVSSVPFQSFFQSPVPPLFQGLLRVLQLLWAWLWHSCFKVSSYSNYMVIFFYFHFLLSSLFGSLEQQCLRSQKFLFFKATKSSLFAWILPWCKSIYLFSIFIHSIIFLLTTFVLQNQMQIPWVME